MSRAKQEQHTAFYALYNKVSRVEEKLSSLPGLLIRSNRGFSKRFFFVSVLMVTWIFISDIDGPLPWNRPLYCCLDTFRRRLSIKCIWSTCTLSSTTSQPSRSSKIRIVFDISKLTLSFNTLYLNFGTQTIWYWQCHTTCDNLWNLLMYFLLALCCGDNIARMHE